MNRRLGWHSRGYLPHFDGYGAAQHVVFRTASSLPVETLQQAETMGTNEGRTWLDGQLDMSNAGRLFSNADAASIMEDTILYFDGDRFDLLAWCVMPNHVHALIVVLGENRLGDVVRTWKMQATRRLSCGSVFAKDYYDRFIRNSKHMETTLAYIENNPVKAGLCLEAHEWQWSSASRKAKAWVPNTANCPLFLS